MSAFGKMRSQPEFVGAVGGEPHASFTRWLDEGIGLAMATRGEPWRKAFGRGASHAFLYRAPETSGARSVLAGVVRPSEDSFGRPFPFTVTTELDDATSATHVPALPVAARRFLREAAVVCRASRELDVGAVIAQLAKVVPPSAIECSDATQDLEDWAARSGQLGPLWRALFPEGGAQAAAHVIDTLAAQLRARRTEVASSSAPLRLPLGGGGAAAASFWIKTVRTIAGGSRRLPAAFWPVEQSHGAVLIQAGEATPAAFGSIWGASHEGQPVVELAAPAACLAAAPPALPTDVRQLLADPAAKVGDLFAALASLD